MPKLRPVRLPRLIVPLRRCSGRLDCAKGRVGGWLVATRGSSTRNVERVAASPNRGRRCQRSAAIGRCPLHIACICICAASEVRGIHSQPLCSSPQPTSHPPTTAHDAITLVLDICSAPAVSHSLVTPHRSSAHRGYIQPRAFRLPRPCRATAWTASW